VLIVENQVYRIVEGRDTLRNMARAVIASAGSKEGFTVNLAVDDGLKRTILTPVAYILENEDVVLMSVHEFGTKVVGKMLVFKNDQLDREVGSLLLT
jgi:hypothetical protein